MSAPACAAVSLPTMQLLKRAPGASEARDLIVSAVSMPVVGQRIVTFDAIAATDGAGIATGIVTGVEGRAMAAVSTPFTARPVESTSIAASASGTVMPY